MKAVSFEICNVDGGSMGSDEVSLSRKYVVCVKATFKGRKEVQVEGCGSDYTLQRAVFRSINAGLLKKIYSNEVMLEPEKVRMGFARLPMHAAKHRLPDVVLTYPVTSFKLISGSGADKDLLTAIGKAYLALFEAYLSELDSSKS